jgi:hypothetical protein
MTDLLETIATNGGFTYDPKADKLYDTGDVEGYAIAIPGTEQIIGGYAVSRETFAQTFADVLTDPGLAEHLATGAVVGGWYSPERGVYMIELTNIVTGLTREEAIAIGQLRNQEAIYDLGTGEEVPTGGTGDAPAASTH